MSDKSLTSYNYDSPDGKDCTKKTIHSTKLASLLGVSYGALDVMLLSPPGSVAISLGRTVQTTSTFAAAGAVYASTSCLLGDFRGKDDILNHAIGGCVAGAIFGVQRGNGKLGSGMCLGLGSLAAFMKSLRDFQKTLPPNLAPTHKEQGTFHHYDRYYGVRST